MFARILVTLIVACSALCATAHANRYADGDGTTAAVAQSDQPPPPTQPRTIDSQSFDADIAQDFRRQLGDQNPQPFDPAHPRSAADVKRIDAIAWYMLGRMRERRNDFRGALAAYKKSVALDPQALHVLQAIVPLAFGLKLTEEGIKYAQEAVKLDPTDHVLLRRVGLYMASQRLFPDAIKYLKQALDSPKLRRDSGIYVTINRDLALLYETTGESEKAADCLEVVFEALTVRGKYSLDFRTRARLERNAATTFENIGQAFLRADRTDLAIRAFERAAKARKGRPGTLNFNLAQVYLQTKHFDEALQKLQGYFDAQLQSKGRAAYDLLAEILEKLDKSQELIPRLEALSQQDPQNSTLQFYLAEKDVGLDRLQDAENLYEKTLNATNDLEGHLGLAVIYRKQNKPAELLLRLAKVFSRLSSDKQQAVKLDAELKTIAKDKSLVNGMIAAGRKMTQGDNAELDFAGCYLLAGLAARTEESTAAVEFYRVALTQTKNRSQVDVIYREMGQHLMQVKDYSQAAGVYREAADEPRLQESRIEFLFFLSQAHELHGASESALQAVAEAKKLSPDNALLQYQEGWIHYHSHQWDKAIQIFEKVMQEFSSQQEIVRRCSFSLSNIFVQRGEMRKGEEILEKILVESPDDPSVNNDLGYLYADQGKNLQKAEAMIRKAITAEPDNVAYMDSMGWILFKLNRFDEALGYLEKAANSPDGNDSVIWDHLGDCYSQLRQTQKARKAWQKALDLAAKEARPDKKLVKRVEEKLKRDPSDSPSDQSP